jgi:hypothetical protein
MRLDPGTFRSQCVHSVVSTRLDNARATQWVALFYIRHIRQGRLAFVETTIAGIPFIVEPGMEKMKTDI